MDGRAYVLADRATWLGFRNRGDLQILVEGDRRPVMAALEAAEAAGRPYDLSSLQLVISSGVMWSAEVKQGLLARGNFLCLDSLGSSEGIGFAGSVTAPGAEQRTAADAGFPVLVRHARSPVDQSWA